MNFKDDLSRFSTRNIWFGKFLQLIPIIKNIY